MTSQVTEATLSDSDLKELDAIIKKVNKYRIPYLILEIILVLVAITMVVSFFLTFNWIFLLLAIMMLTVLFRIHPFTKNFNSSFLQLKQDLQYNKKAIVSGLLQSISVSDRDTIYSINDTEKYEVKHWQTYIGWRMSNVEFLPNKKITLHFLPKSKMLLAAAYEGTNNTTETKPLTEEQKAAFASTKLNVSKMVSITGIVTEKLDMQFKVGSMLLPSKAANNFRSINNSTLNNIRLGSDLYQLNQSSKFVVGETATVNVFE